MSKPHVCFSPFSMSITIFELDKYSSSETQVKGVPQYRKADLISTFSIPLIEDLNNRLVRNRISSIRIFEDIWRRLDEKISRAAKRRRFRQKIIHIHIIIYYSKFSFRLAFHALLCALVWNWQTREILKRMIRCSNGAEALVQPLHYNTSQMISAVTWRWVNTQQHKNGWIKKTPKRKNSQN